MEKQVQRAIGVLWVSLIVQILPWTMDLHGNNSEAKALAASVLLKLVVCGVMIAKLGEGRGWARYAYLVLMAEDIATALVALDIASKGPMVFVTLAVILLCMQAYAMLLLFTSPGAAWFGQRRDEARTA